MPWLLCHHLPGHLIRMDTTPTTDESVWWRPATSDKTTAKSAPEDIACCNACSSRSYCRMLSDSSFSIHIQARPVVLVVLHRHTLFVQGRNSALSTRWCRRLCGQHPAEELQKLRGEMAQDQALAALLLKEHGFDQVRKLVFHAKCGKICLVLSLANLQQQS